MRFRLEQTFDAHIDAVARAFTEPDLYTALGALPKLGQPEVLGRREAGDVVDLQVRYQFTGDLSAAARRVVDPARLSWVEHSTHDLARHQVDFTMVPDNYGNLLRASGRYSFEPDGPAATRRVAEGEVSVRVPLVGKAVENAIVSGIREHLAEEVPLVERYLAG
ncbi:MAG: DUF2505 domain-containing protein [Actinomycetota bacterium]|jgi:hypothetical protein|nr:DUF2505 domain-containing protein [Actinomycetota bacterium]